MLVCETLSASYQVREMPSCLVRLPHYSLFATCYCAGGYEIAVLHDRLRGWLALRLNIWGSTALKYMKACLAAL